VMSGFQMISLSYPPRPSKFQPPSSCASLSPSRRKAKMCLFFTILDSPPVIPPVNRCPVSRGFPSRTNAFWPTLSPPNRSFLPPFPTFCQNRPVSFPAAVRDAIFLSSETYVKHSLSPKRRLILPRTFFPLPTRQKSFYPAAL